MQQRPLWKKSLFVIVVLAAVAAAVFYLRGGHDTTAGGKGGKVAQGTVIPIKVAAATRSDIDLSLKVIGRAEAYSTVNLRSRVDGRLDSLAFTPGAHLKKGELIAKVDPRPLQAALAQARGNVARDQAQLVKARADLARFSAMLDKGFVSHADFDLYKSNVGVAEAALQSDRAGVEAAETQLGFTTIVAPFDGVAGAALVYPGASLTADTTDIVVLNQVEPIRVTFSIPEDSLPAVRLARQRGDVPIGVRLGGDAGPPLEGVLEFIDNGVDATTGTIVLKGRFANTEGRLVPGQFVDVSLPTTRIANAISVPVIALQSSSNGNFVFIVKADNTVEQRPVTIGPSTADRVVIDKGVNEGEHVVTEGQLLLVAGTQVRVS